MSCDPVWSALRPGPRRHNCPPRLSAYRPRVPSRRRRRLLGASSGLGARSRCTSAPVCSRRTCRDGPRGFDPAQARAFAFPASTPRRKHPRKEGRIVSILSKPEVEYPPRAWEGHDEFTPPGPVSHVLTNYLAMCAPRSRAHRAPRRPHVNTGSNRTTSS